MILGTNARNSDVIRVRLVTMKVRKNCVNRYNISVMSNAMNGLSFY